MRIFLAVIATIISIGSAVAADAYFRTSSTKDAPLSLSVGNETAVNWSGIYIGGQVGYGVGSHEIDANQTFQTEEGPESFSLFNLNGLASSGLVGGINGGLDVQRGNVVIGALGGFTFTGMETTFDAFNNQFSATLKKQNERYVGGRAGILVTPKSLIYIGAAYVASEYKMTANVEGFGAISKDYDGIKPLVGIETVLRGGVFAKLEWQHDFYGDVTWINQNGLKITDTLDEDKFMLGVSFKFGAEPLSNSLFK